MKQLIITIVVLVITLAVVSPAYADDGTIKPACTESHGFWARLFGQCVVLDSNQNTATQQGDTIGETMTESNPVHDNTWAMTCRAYWAAPVDQRNPQYKGMCEQAQYNPNK